MVEVLYDASGESASPNWVTQKILLVICTYMHLFGICGDYPHPSSTACSAGVAVQNESIDKFLDVCPHDGVRQVVDRPIYGELIVRVKKGDPSTDDDERERGGNDTKTRLNDTRRAGVLASPYIDEVWLSAAAVELYITSPPGRV